MNTISSNELIESRTSILSSEFICLMMKTMSIEVVHETLKTIREVHPKANHHCLAYRIGAESIQEFASDDGEPSGTAGIPMLNVFKRNDLTNIFAVVVRYFGGTKLGKKGLIDAYRLSVELALEKTKLNPIQKRFRFKILYPYSLSSEIQKISHLFDLQIESESFGEQVEQQVTSSFEDSTLCISRLEVLQHKGLALLDSEIYYS